MSRTLSGLFLVGALNRPRKRKRDELGKSPDHPGANWENPRKMSTLFGSIFKGTAHQDPPLSAGFGG